MCPWFLCWTCSIVAEFFFNCKRFLCRCSLLYNKFVPFVCVYYLQTIFKNICVGSRNCCFMFPCSDQFHLIGLAEIIQCTKQRSRESSPLKPKIKWVWKQKLLALILLYLGLNLYIGKKHYLKLLKKKELPFYVIPRVYYNGQSAKYTSLVQLLFQGISAGFSDSYLRVDFT